MAVWHIEAVDDRVKLTYYWSFNPESEPPQRCGEIELSAESDLEAWVFDQMARLDYCVLSNGHGVFRHTSPVLVRA